MVVGVGVVVLSAKLVALVALYVVLADVIGAGVVVVGAGVVLVLVTGAVDVEAIGVVVPYTGNARDCITCFTSKASA